jgi:hypothetical protein
MNPSLLKVFVVCTLFILVISCTEKELDALPAPSIQKPTITISNTIEGATLAMNSDVNRFVDTTIRDTIFYLYSPGGPSQVTLHFTIQVEDFELATATWILSGDTTKRSGKSIAVDFTGPTNLLTATCLVEWTPRRAAQIRTDTVRQTFQVLREPKLFGTYKGRSTESAAEMQISLGEIKDIEGQQSWGITGLFAGFPYALPVVFQSAGFGLDAAPFPYPMRYQVAGTYCSQPYAIGYLHAGKDSITIKYAYAQYQSAQSVDGIQTKHYTFKGVRM